MRCRLGERGRSSTAALSSGGKRKSRWFLALAVGTLVLTACQGARVSSAKEDNQTGPAPSRADAASGSSRVFSTRTGKTIVVTETHPVGQSLSTIVIHTEGFEHDRPETYEDRDPISEVFLADLDGNGFEEIYIITTSQGSGSYGFVLGFASNRDKSLSIIHFPEIEEGDVAFEGYMGHDSFTISGRKLLRSFPVYREGNRNSEPTGGRRTVTYGLHPGEAMWQLSIEKVETAGP